VRLEPQVFGNTTYSLRGTAVLAVLIAVAVSLGVYFVAPFEGTNLQHAIESALFGLGVFTIIAGAILPTCLFSLRVDDTHVSHLLVGKVVLSSKPWSQLRSIEIAGAIGATLTFHDGTRIRFLGARLEFLRDLCDHLQTRCGGRLKIDISAYASSLLAHGRPKRTRRK
jgi:hypothetical protein